MTIEEMNARKRELGYNYEQIAQMSGVPLSTVRKVLGGATRSPRFATLQALEKVLGSEMAETGYYSSHEGTFTGVSEARAAYAVKKQGEYTLDDYLALPEERRVELIDGVFYDMSSPMGHHQIIAGEIYAALLAYIRSKKGKCIPFIAPMDVQLDCDNKTIVQPDVLILCDRSKYTSPRIVGAPDFVVEILSKSTRSKDMFIKLNKYRSAKVRECWIVDPDKKTVMTFLFEAQDEYAIYSFRDKVPVGIYGGDCVIDFAQIDDYISPLM